VHPPCEQEDEHPHRDEHASLQHRKPLLVYRTEYASTLAAASQLGSSGCITSRQQLGQQCKVVRFPYVARICRPWRSPLTTARTG